MRPMLPGFVVALGCSLFAMEAAAQSTYDTSGRYVAGSVVTGQVPSQPLAPGTVVASPSSPVNIVGQPIVTGGVVGEPVNFGRRDRRAGDLRRDLDSRASPGPDHAVQLLGLAPAPSRVYVQYGPGDQFPFHGSPYGSPNDRWSWYTMGGGSGRYLAKYYYPILHEWGVASGEWRVARRDGEQRCLLPAGCTRHCPARRLNSCLKVS